MLIDIKDYPHLMKDPVTGAIINRDSIGRNKYRSQLKQRKYQENRIKELETKVDSLDNKIDMIINLLKEK